MPHSKSKIRTLAHRESQEVSETSSKKAKPVSNSARPLGLEPTWREDPQMPSQPRWVHPPAPYRAADKDDREGVPRPNRCPNRVTLDQRLAYEREACSQATKTAKAARHSALREVSGHSDEAPMMESDEADPIAYGGLQDEDDTAEEENAQLDRREPCTDDDAISVYSTPEQSREASINQDVGIVRAEHSGKGKRNKAIPRDIEVNRQAKVSLACDSRLKTATHRYRFRVRVIQGLKGPR